ncbi:hypothetical protein DFH27DRAFT_162037 [Peziza echinospora]|nr:hypothetical protein DFH27DRAFT_162037 [Peziza echinospora]
MRLLDYILGFCFVLLFDRSILPFTYSFACRELYIFLEYGCGLSLSIFFFIKSHLGSKVFFFFFLTIIIIIQHHRYLSRCWRISYHIISYHIITFFQICIVEKREK